MSFSKTAVPNFLVSLKSLQAAIPRNPWRTPVAQDSVAPCIHHLFEQQVQKTPQAIAIATETEQITYQQLNRQANRLAYQLSTLGTGPLVGICVEYSVDMILGLLGVLKAGSAYVPIDHQAAAEYINHILQDSQIKVVLTQTHLEADLVTHVSDQTLTLLCLDRDQWTKMRSCPDLDTSVTADDLAHVIYTPSAAHNSLQKVETSHGNISQQLKQRQPKDSPNNQAQTLQTLSLSSTDSLGQICWPLLTGNQLVMDHQDKQ